MLDLLKGCEGRGFEPDCKGRGEWQCFPARVFYCSDIPEGKDMPCVKHVISVRRQCVRCPVMLEGVRSLKTRNSRALTELHKKTSSCTC